jgi:hypothetical protein|tara:strand:+ start:484 stop:669 length:186 start_codon:yes stop_codon:yes gene_type:complete
MKDSVIRAFVASLLGCLFLTSYYYRERANIFEGKYDELQDAARMNDFDGDGEAWVLVYLGE